MKYTNNETLKDDFKELLENHGIKQIFIAEKLGITRQNFSKKLNTKKLDFDDISQFLDAIGYELHYQFVKKTDN